MDQVYSILIHILKICPEHPIEKIEFMLNIDPMELRLKIDPKELTEPNERMILTPSTANAPLTANKQKNAAPLE